MEFQTEAQKTCYEKISPWLREIFGEMVLMREDAPGFAIPVGSAFGEIIVFPWGDDDSTICTRAYVVAGAEITPELTRYLLARNIELRFGAFGVDEDDDIVFEHSIVGSTCDKNELKASVLAVVMTADRFDDEIVARWGGQRRLDRLRNG
jgi:hypothetical protein